MSSGTAFLEIVVGTGNEIGIETLTERIDVLATRMCQNLERALWFENLDGLREVYEQVLVPCEPLVGP